MGEAKRRAAEIADGKFKGKSSSHRTETFRAWKFVDAVNVSTRRMAEMLREAEKPEVESTDDFAFVNPDREIRR